MSPKDDAIAMVVAEVKKPGPRVAPFHEVNHERGESCDTSE